MSNNRNNNVERFAEMFRALSNPHRLSIYMRLASCCEPGTRCSTTNEIGTCVGDVSRGLGIAPSTVSHHLKELRQAGLIRMEKNGQKSECWVDPESLSELREYLRFDNDHIGKDLD